jgi:UDP-GlcNAc:undecaprenyl-phosphate/decaprenyl-phosphate GlcNAc-1-phosphate transferase
MDDPGHRKIHTSPIPLAGGMAVMTGLWCRCWPGGGGLGWLALKRRRPLRIRFERAGGPTSGPDRGRFGDALARFARRQNELTPLVKFGGQLIVALVVAAAGMRITLFVPSLLFSYGITALWILTVVNAFNFMDNMNGLCAGLGPSAPAGSG